MLHYSKFITRERVKMKSQTKNVLNLSNVNPIKFKLVFTVALIIILIFNNDGVLALNNSQNDFFSFVEDFETEDSIIQPNFYIDNANNPYTKVYIDSSTSGINQKSLHFQSFINSSNALVSINFDLNLPFLKSKYFGFYYNIKHLGGNFRLTVQSVTDASMQLDYGADNQYSWEQGVPILNTPNLLTQDNYWRFFETNITSDIENGLKTPSSPYNEFIPNKLLSLEVFFDEGYVSNELNIDFLFFNNSYVSNQEIQQLATGNNYITTSQSTFSTNIQSNNNQYFIFSNIINNGIEIVDILGIASLVIVAILFIKKKPKYAKKNDKKEDKTSNEDKFKPKPVQKIKSFCPECYSNIELTDIYCYNCGKEI